MRRQLYGMFVGTRWAMGTAKHRAIAACKREMKKQGRADGEVRAMPYPTDTSS